MNNNKNNPKIFLGLYLIYGSIILTVLTIILAILL